MMRFCHPGKGGLGASKSGQEETPKEAIVKVWAGGNDSLSLDSDPENGGGMDARDTEVVEIW